MKSLCQLIEHHHGLHKEQESLEAEHKKDIANLNQEHAQKYNELKVNLEMKEYENQNLSKSNQELETKLHEMNEKVDKLRDENSEVTVIKEMLKSKENIIKNLQIQVTSMMSEVKNKDSYIKNRDYDEEISSLKQQISELSKPYSYAHAKSKPGRSREIYNMHASFEENIDRNQNASKVLSHSKYSKMGYE